MSILNLSCWLLQREIGGYCIGIICLLFCGVSRLVFCGCRSRADASFEDRSLSAITQHTVRVLFPLNLVLLTFWSYLEFLHDEHAHAAIKAELVFAMPVRLAPASQRLQTRDNTEHRLLPLTSR